MLSQGRGLVISTDDFQIHYSKLDDSYRTNSDAQFNIHRYTLEDKSYPTGEVVVRDATEAVMLGDASVNQYQIEANNTLLRTLQRTRSIDYVLMCLTAENIGTVSSDLYTALRKTLKLKFDELHTEICDLKNKLDKKAGKAIDLNIYQKELNALEKNFNTHVLCDVLIEANLNEGCTEPPHYKKLLFHYRNLSSLLDPAKSLVTLTYDHNNRVLHRRTEDPVTQKLTKQQSQIREEMSDIVIFPSSEQKTFHTVQMRAEQIANACYAPLAEHNQRLFGAQNRKKIMRTLRNTWLTTSEVIFLTDEQTLYNINKLKIQAKAEDTWRFIRSGTLTYIGPGESYDRVQEATRDNIEQVRQFAATRLREDKVIDGQTQVGIHSFGLVTDGIKVFDTTKQKVTVDHMAAATENNASNNDGFTLASTNAEGLLHKVVLSKKMRHFVELPTGKKATKRKIFKKEKRLEQAAEIFLSHLKSAKKTGIFHLLLLWCMSGQDRTGTLAEYVIQVLIRESYERKNIIYQNKTINDEEVDLIEMLSIASRHTAVLTAVLVGGSEGAKWDSSVSGLFSDASETWLYLKSADTNKKDSLLEKELKESIKKSSEQAKQLYVQSKNQLNGLVDSALPSEKKSESPDSNPLVPIVRNIHAKCPDEVKATDLYLWREALQLVVKLFKGNAVYGMRLRHEKYDCLRLKKIHKRLKDCDKAKKMAAELLEFIFAKAKFELSKLLPFMNLNPRGSIVEKLYLELPEKGKQVKVGAVKLLIEGLMIVSNLALGLRHYKTKFGESEAQLYYDKDILRLQTLQEKLLHHYKLKKIGGLFLEFIGCVLVLGAIASVLPFVMAVPVAAGSSVVALAIATKALASLHAIWFATTVAGSLLAGGLSLVFGNKWANQANANAALSSNLNAVETKLVKLSTP